MKKVYLLSALGGLLLASCANDDLVTKPVAPDSTNNGAIAFNMKVGNMSRATENLEDVSDNFGVWAIKAKDDDVFKGLDLKLGDANMSANVVMNDYKVYFKDGSGKYGSDWTYVTDDDPTNLPPKQYLKYWDGQVDKVYFFGYAPHNSKLTGNPVSLTKDDTGKVTVDFGTVKTYKSGDDAYLYADAKVCNSSDFIPGSSPAGTPENPKKVNLTFHYLLGQVRIALWESIPGYTVEMMDFKFNGETGEAHGVTAIPANYNSATGYSPGTYANEAKVKVEYSGASYATAKASYYDGVMPSTSDNLVFNNPTDDISELQTAPTLSETVYSVLPAGMKDNSNNALADNCGLQFVMSYKLKAIDTNEVIVVKGARVFVAPEYTQWQENKVYTYIFQITKNSSGTTTSDDPDPNPKDPDPALYPIIFDGMTVVSAAADEVNNNWVVNQTLKFESDVYVVDATAGTPQDVTLNLGYPLTENVDPKITWKVADETVATVTKSPTDENDVVTTTVTNSVKAVAGGHTTLTADYYGTKAQTTIIVATWTDFSTTMSLTVGGTDTLNPITVPAGAPKVAEVVWTSDNEAVATVADGTVTAVAAGTATITATLGNKTCTTTVTVTE